MYNMWGIRNIKSETNFSRKHSGPNKFKGVWGIQKSQHSVLWSEKQGQGRSGENRVIGHGTSQLRRVMWSKTFTEQIRCVQIVSWITLLSATAGVCVCVYTGEVGDSNGKVHRNNENPPPLQLHLSRGKYQRQWDLVARITEHKDGKSIFFFRRTEQQQKVRAFRTGMLYFPAQSAEPSGSILVQAEGLGWAGCGSWGHPDSHWGMSLGGGTTHPRLLQLQLRSQNCEMSSEPATGDPSSVPSVGTTAWKGTASIAPDQML